jgi:hypothetical protein
MSYPAAISQETMALPAVAEEQPLIRVVDDAQWLDQASGQVRRSWGAGSKPTPSSCSSGHGMALRSMDWESSDPGRLADHDARAVLESEVDGRLGVRVQRPNHRSAAMCSSSPFRYLEPTRPNPLSEVEALLRSPGYARPSAPPRRRTSITRTRRTTTPAMPSHTAGGIPRISRPAVPSPTGWIVRMASRL